MKRRRLLLAAVSFVSAVYLAGLFYYASVRPIDGDEGFYVTVSRLVWEGRKPYRDFFYQQAPLLPYLYSWIWAIRPGSLVAMRFLSATCGGITVLLWGVFLITSKRIPTAVALATFAAILLNPYWVSWSAVVKTYAIANLLMSIAAICLYPAVQSGRARWYFISALALGLCTSVRSLYGPLIPAIFVWLFFLERRAPQLPGARHHSRTLAFFAGSICGLLPMIASFAGAPRAFLFNNVWYHGLDAGYLFENGGIVSGYQSASNTLLVYFAFVGVLLLGLHPYFTAALAVAFVGGWSLVKSPKVQDSGYTQQDHLYFQLAWLMLLVYTIAAFTPFPPYDQYFTTPLVPLLLPFIAEGLGVLLSRGRKWALLMAMAAIALFVTGIGRDAWQYSRAPASQLSSYRTVTKIVEAHSGPEDTVLSFWPGYVFAAGRRYFPGLEDQFTYRIMSSVGREARSQYHVASKDQIMNAISQRAVRLIIIASPETEWMAEFEHNLSSDERQSFHALIDTNYSLVGRVDDVEVYERQGGVLQ